MADVFYPNRFSVSGSTHELEIDQEFLTPRHLIRKSTQNVWILRVFRIVQATDESGRNKADTVTRNAGNNEFVIILTNCA